MVPKLTRGKVTLWQAAFLLLSTSWLLAPAANHLLSYRSTLISQYETAGQPYAAWFRAADFLAGSLLVWLVTNYFRHRLKKIPILLLLVTGLGMMIDPVFTTSCTVHNTICQESFSFDFLIHAIETAATATAVIGLALYDSLARKKLVSLLFLVFQIAYGVLFLTQYANQQHFNTASQFVYQCGVVVWLAWFCRDFLAQNQKRKLSDNRTRLIRYLVSGWAFLNGLLAILISLAHIHLFGRLMGLYFAGNSAWLAQHGVIIGVILLYLSRHIWRGEARARQLFLIITGIEVLKYAAITPNIPLLLLYGLTFCLLFIVADEFDRGVIPMTWQVRLKDLSFLLAALLLAVLLAFATLDRDSRISRITARTFDNFSDYAFRSDSFSPNEHERLRSALLADTSTTFLGVSAIAILWVLFRPYGLKPTGRRDFAKVRSRLEAYSNSSEDYFKLWPSDKQYFWSRQGFVAYKVVGPIAFALPDPITSPRNRPALVGEFVEWARARRLRACFLPVSESSLKIYGDLPSLKIGASAVVNVDQFLTATSKDKWWRWKKNRAIKSGYEYRTSQPPHSTELIRSLRRVSDSWLETGGHQERGFALGYFDESYLRQCQLHYLTDSSGEVAAFVNQLPNFRAGQPATIDMLRYAPEAGDAMPFLLADVIESVQNDHSRFDLGFVPFADTRGPLQAIAKTLSAGRFSAKGLKQFKNKFDPDWQSQYLVYDGDVADLALIALNLERAMETD
jgi:lysylphosphatidylglycerol synthetase-like protein (DUF2156 family)